MRSLALWCLVWPVFVLTGRDAAAGESLLPNGSFEKINNETGLPEGWAVNQRDKAQFITDGKNHWFRFKDGGRIKCMLNVNPNWKTLRLSARMRTSKISLGRESWNLPRVLLTWITKDKLIHHGLDLTKDVDWSLCQNTCQVPPEALNLQIEVGLFGCQGTFEIDDIKIEPVKGAEVAVVKTSSKSPTKAPSAAKWPALEDVGICFNADVARNLMLRRVKPECQASSLLSIGPGCPGSSGAPKERVVKYPAHWKALETPKDLGGNEAAPDVMLLKLPEVLLEKKPEVVLLWGDANGKRSAKSSERYDWEDVLTICLRMGALPVIVLPNGEVSFLGGGGAAGLLNEPKKNGEPKKEEPAGTANLEALRRVMILVGSAQNIPMLEQAPFATTSERLAKMLHLLEKHVLGRTTGTETKKPDEAE